jgi:putative Holliday junction resolvase
MSDSSDTPAEQPFPVFGCLFGLDHGTKRIGIAMTDDEQRMSVPLENYDCQSPEWDAQYITKLAEAYAARGLVIGLPVHVNGEESVQSLAARAFGERMAVASGLPVCFQDERYSSTLAEDRLQEAGLNTRKHKGRVDMLAAQILLQSFLDRSERDSPPQPLFD